MQTNHLVTDCQKLPQHVKSPTADRRPQSSGVEHRQNTTLIPIAYPAPALSSEPSSEYHKTRRKKYSSRVNLLPPPGLPSIDFHKDGGFVVLAPIERTKECVETEKPTRNPEEPATLEINSFSPQDAPPVEKGGEESYTKEISPLPDIDAPIERTTYLDHPGPKVAPVIENSDGDVSIEPTKSSPEIRKPISYASVVKENLVFGAQAGGPNLATSGLSKSSAFKADKDIPPPPDRRFDFKKYSLSRISAGSYSFVSAGIANMGNTCYMSSALQCLFSTDPLAALFLSGENMPNLYERKNNTSKQHLTAAFGRLVREAYCAKDDSDSVITATQLKDVVDRRTPQFVGYEQQDAQEFLTFFLNGLHEDLSKTFPQSTREYSEKEFDKLGNVQKAFVSWNRHCVRTSSVISDLLCGQLESTVTCKRCRIPSTTYEPFWGLSLPLFKPTSCSLYECLSEYTKDETLGDDEKYICPRCKTRELCWKRIRLHKLPAILVIHNSNHGFKIDLKRFSHTYQSRSKLEADVSFPAQGLSMDAFMTMTRGADRGLSYDLYSAITHVGGLNGGHYTAFCLQNGAWYEKDDEKSSVSELPVISGGSTPFIDVGRALDTTATIAATMSSFATTTFEEILDDLSSRFIINVPNEELASVERICFQIEQAHWFYEDFVREQNPAMPSFGLKAFCAKFFQHCPLLHQWQNEHEKAFDNFMQYKVRVPVCGAILLNQNLEKCLLVKGWSAKAGWGFPKGKINKDESQYDCASREVLEETGYDISPLMTETDYLQITIREQTVRLYIIPGLPEDTVFQCQTRKEISKIEWHRLVDLPAYSATQKTAPPREGRQTNKFYMVIPFMGKLRKWIQAKKAAQKKAGRKATPVHNISMGTMTDEEQMAEISTNLLASMFGLSTTRVLPAQELSDSALKELIGITPTRHLNDGMTRDTRILPSTTVSDRKRRRYHPLLGFKFRLQPILDALGWVT